jgi:hypothetical protein
MKKNFKVAAIAEHLDIAPATVYLLCAQKRLGHVRIGAGRGTIRISEQHLADYLADAAVRTRKPAPPPRTKKPKLKHLTPS